MAIADDIIFDLTNKIMKRDGGAGATVYSANAVYSYCQDTFDELDHMSYVPPMEAATPTSYTMINGWYIQEELTHFIDGGAIQTNGYTDEIRTLICSVTSWVNFITTDVGLLLTGDGTSDTGYILDYDNNAYKIWVRMVDSGDTFDDADEGYTSSGTGVGQSVAISTTGEHVFANPYSLGTLEGTPDIYVFQDSEKISSWWAAGHFDILIKVTESDVDIDSKAITVFCRIFSDEYTNFYIVLTTAGQNAVPLETADDPSNQTAEATIEDYQDGDTANVDISFNFSAPFQYDIGDGNGDQDYNVQIDCDGVLLSIVYEVCKYWTQDGATGKTFKTNTDGSDLDGEEYRYADDSYPEVKKYPLGSYVGGKFYGARGVYFINLHGNDAQAFQLIDAGGTTRDPPNYQSFILSGLASGDRCTIFKANAGLVDKTQYNIKAVQGDVAYVDIDESIPNDTPTAGTVIVKDSITGTEYPFTYTSWSGDRFTITGTTGESFQTADTVFVPYIYEQSAGASVSEAVVYVSDRDLIIDVRVAGFKPYTTLGTFDSGGYSLLVNLADDPQYA